jgi:DNA-binding MarR family transcriptional regulator
MYIHRIMKRPNQAPKTLRRDASALAESCPGAQSRLAARRITQFLDRELAETGISSAQLALLAQIATADDDTLGALARRSGLEQSTLSRNLRTLEAAGLVEITQVESDQRRRAVWLTETGARRLEAAIPRWRRAKAAATRLVPLARRLAEASRGLLD